MAQITKLLKFQSQAFKEFKITNVEVEDTAAKFTSQLSSGHTRVGFFAYNNSASASGEVFWGDSSVTENNGFPIPRGAAVEIPVVTSLDVYFIAVSGELGDLRVLELA